MHRALLLQIGFDGPCTRNTTSPWAPTRDLVKEVSTVHMEGPRCGPRGLCSDLQDSHSIRVGFFTGGVGNRYSMEHTGFDGYGFELTCTIKTGRTTSDLFYESPCLAKCKRKRVTLEKFHKRQCEHMGTKENGGLGAHGTCPLPHPHPST